ncbi:hypothetical protein [Bradyrhizobium sp. AZCC 2289]|uniref:hypothetical protein n=1 Tax=Bradyrhizobium sp. AZCC 2289 TaxID=3117026 RepID=UPI002FF080D8
MEQAAKETVIVVHGTWAAPELGKSRWYQPVDRHSTEPFTAKLDAALRERGSPARCWAHCGDGNQIFHWSGENSWIARTHAALALGNYVAALQSSGWCCHIVAHSHGGNIVLEALPQIAATQQFKGPSAKIVTLGTPFMDTASPISASARRIRQIQVVAGWMGFSLFIFVLAFGLFETLMGNDRFNSSLDYWYEAVLLFLLLIPLLLFVYQRFSRRNRVTGRPASAAEGRPQILAVGSLMDEAWQVLHHMQNIANPLAVRSNIFAYLLSSARQNISRSFQIARIHGARSYSDLGTTAKWILAITHALFLVWMAYGVFVFAFFIQRPPGERDILVFLATALLSIVTYMFLFVLYLTRMLGPTFYSAFLLPVRWCAHVVGFAPSIFTEIATYVVRSRGWSVLLTIGMGLDGYRHKPPLVEQHPSYIEKNFITYENMPMGAQQRALATRSAWIGRHFGDVTETLAKLVITSADISLLLRSIESDQSLVHAAYYTDDECIARIADWIAGRG